MHTKMPSLWKKVNNAWVKVNKDNLAGKWRGKL